MIQLCCSLILAFLLTGSQDPAPRIVREKWPNGSTKVEYAVTVDATSVEIKDGEYRSYFENGKIESEGQYLKGVRTGAWQTTHANGQVASKGRFVKDRREGKWEYWRADGQADVENTGTHQFESILYPNGRASFEGYRVNDRQQGPWTYYWDSGAVQCRGAFRNGLRQGEWIFWVQDGMPSRLLVSGIYDGERQALLTNERIVELRRQATANPVGGQVFSRSSVPAWFNTLKADADSTRLLLDEEKVQAVAHALLTLDPTSVSDLMLMREWSLALAARALRHGFGWPSDATEGERTDPAEAVRAWAGLLGLVGNDAVFWQLDLRGGCPGHTDWSSVSPCRVLCTPMLRTEERADNGESGMQLPIYARRFGNKRMAGLRGGAGTQQPLQSALEWLAAHQSPDGSWDCDEFMSNCPEASAGKCSGPGGAANDVGVTSLALLAFLGDGNTLRRGRFSSQVTRGVMWLRAQQDLTTGKFEAYGQWAIYSNACAAMALGEAYAFCEHPVLRSTLERAVGYLLRAQNLDSGWRYACPPDGGSDTSVTAWVMSALWTAKQAHLEIPKSALLGGLNWIEEMTDPVTARVGYEVIGSPSSRYLGLNDQFVLETAEPMTGAAVACRLMAGQSRASTPIVAKHINLLITRLPRWNPVARDADLLAIYHGTYAVTLAGNETELGSWNKSMKKVLLESQQKSGHLKGSWDPKDAWGSFGGRICTTALAALCLESYFRYDPVAFTDGRR